MVIEIVAVTCLDNNCNFVLYSCPEQKSTTNGRFVSFCFDPATERYQRPPLSHRPHFGNHEFKHKINLLKHVITLNSLC